MTIEEAHMSESVKTSNESRTFKKKIIIWKEYPSLISAREEALNFGKRNNVKFVTRT